MKHKMIVGILVTVMSFNCAASDQGNKLIASTLFAGSVIAYKTIGYLNAHKKASQEVDNYIALLQGACKHTLTPEEKNILLDIDKKLIQKDKDGCLIVTSKQGSDIEEIRNCLISDHVVSYNIYSGAISFNDLEE